MRATPGAKPSRRSAPATTSPNAPASWAPSPPACTRRWPSRCRRLSLTTGPSPTSPTGSPAGSTGPSARCPSSRRTSRLRARCWTQCATWPIALRCNGCTATCTSVRCSTEGPVAGSSSTSRASRCARWPTATAPTSRCATSPACCARSTTRPGHLLVGADAERHRDGRPGTPVGRGLPRRLLRRLRRGGRPRPPRQRHPAPGARARQGAVRGGLRGRQPAVVAAHPPRGRRAAAAHRVPAPSPSTESAPIPRSAPVPRSQPARRRTDRCGPP